MQTIVKITDFNQQNPRSDRKNFSWFRFDHNFFNARKYFGMDLAERILLIYLRCVASEENNDEIILQYEHVAHSIGVPLERINDILKSLVKRGVIEILGYDASFEEPLNESSTALEEPFNAASRGLNVGLRTNERTNVTNEDSAAETEYVPLPDAVAPPDDFSEAPRRKSVDRSVIPELTELASFLEGKVTRKIQQAWVTQFGAEFIVWCFKGADRKSANIGMWLELNPGKAPRSRWDAFYSRWLYKDFEAYRKRLPSQKKSERVHPAFKTEE